MATTWAGSVWSSFTTTRKKASHILPAQPQFSEIGSQQLPLLRRALNMKPVPPTLARFAELQDKYFALLDIPPTPDFEA